MKPILEVKNLTYIYSAGTPFEHKALDDISFSVERGEFIGIIGHTGSGKSTLMQQLNGLLKPTSGTVLLDGQDIWSDKKLTRQARFQVGLVFQYPEYQLFEETVYKDIAFGPKNMGLSAEESIAASGKPPGSWGFTGSSWRFHPLTFPAARSAGWPLRASLPWSRKFSFWTNPPLALTPWDARKFWAIFSPYRKAKNATIMMVSHSMEDVARLTDRLLVMNGQALLWTRPPAQVFTHAEELTQMGLNIPQVTQVFLELKKLGLDVKNVYTIDQAAAEIRRLKGEPPCLKTLPSASISRAIPSFTASTQEQSSLFWSVYMVTLFVASGGYPTACCSCSC